MKNADEMLATGAQALSAQYRVWLCDAWGVVHDGRRANSPACEALRAHRQSGGVVVLITNAPRPASSVVPQMRGFGVPDDASDATVTSGDVTRELLMRHAGGNVFKIGPDEDVSLIEGLPVNFTNVDGAHAVLVTGLRNDGRHGEEAETPESYREELRAIARRGLPLICANPDRVVGVGGKLFPCAGALADIYEDEGGSVEMAGKPYAPIYQVALERACEALGRQVDKQEVLAIGDGLPTDVAGAHANNIAVHFITGGIHAEDHAGVKARAIADGLVVDMPELKVAGVAPELYW